jgi:hypothetical protein
VRIGDRPHQRDKNFWSLLKRSIKGTQIHVAPTHLNRYVTDRIFAYNHRNSGDLGRTRAVLGNVNGRRLTWAQLTDQSARPAPKAVRGRVVPDETDWFQGE